ncbi:hypothetical protein [Marinibacterium profundimaris]|uniref:hypothetical protein n=1 Tax=Marinibacterium profundimaris TaxID=1679460 RepID=UPI001303D2FC|nr:hypothetical protein [Marinibacterium profundimaris]
MPDIRLVAARRIITMDTNRPEAAQVAVRDGRILAVGGASGALKDVPGTLSGQEAPLA